MNSVLQTGGSLFRALGTAFNRLLSSQPAPAGTPVWNRPSGQVFAPSCLRRAMEGGRHLLVDPETEERTLSALTKSEAEMVMDWIENNGFQFLELSFQEETGFVVRWDVR